MPIAIEPDETFDYVLPSEKHLLSSPDGAKPTTFILRTLSGPDARILLSGATGDQRGCDAMYDAVRCTLVGWRNFMRKNGEEAPFETVEENLWNKKRTVPNEKTMKWLNTDTIAELANQARSGNQLTRDDVKN